MLMKIFETEEEKVTGDWRNFCSEEYTLSLYWSLTYHIVCLEGGRLRYRYEDSIEAHLIDSTRTSLNCA
jgi:hypothetical protein